MIPRSDDRAPSSVCGSDVSARASACDLVISGSMRISLCRPESSCLREDIAMAPVILPGLKDDETEDHEIDETLAYDVPGILLGDEE